MMAMNIVCLQLISTPWETSRASNGHFSTFFSFKENLPKCQTGWPQDFFPLYLSLSKIGLSKG